MLVGWLLLQATWNPYLGRPWEKMQNPPQNNPTRGAKKLGHVSINFHASWLKAVLKDI